MQAVELSGGLRRLSSAHQAVICISLCMACNSR
jgi:hypothetical protein